MGWNGAGDWLKKYGIYDPSDLNAGFKVRIINKI